MTASNNITNPTTTSSTIATSTTTPTTTTAGGLSKDSKILCINFNQDQGCFAIGHESGFLVYNTNPVDLRVKRNFSTSTTTNGSTNGGLVGGNGSIGHISMLHRTNYLGLIGGGKSPKFPVNKLIIWDDLKRKVSLNLEFETPVLNVLLSRIRIIVVLVNKIFVYGFSAPPKMLTSYDTLDNEFGIADLASVSVSGSGNSLGSINDNSNSSISSMTSLSNKYQTLAFPGRSVGQIQIVNVGRNVINIIKAHKSKIRCITLNKTGTLVASASITGTIIRIHSTNNSILLYEFRRGLDRAIITSMKFSPNDNRLAVLSDKHTLHIFNIGNQQENRHHLFNKFSANMPMPQYFKSTWSFCSVNTNKYHLDNTTTQQPDQGVIGWSSDDCVIIVWQGKRIWEKYVIVESTTSDITPGTTTWEIVRSSWKSLDSE
ncbi:SVP1-like protein 2 [Spathaspora sp. JA1]|nr:SVP1-like protein 2 [Spathaspora sp. JA1]